MLEQGGLTLDAVIGEVLYAVSGTNRLHQLHTSIDVVQEVRMASIKLLSSQQTPWPMSSLSRRSGSSASSSTRSVKTPASLYLA